MATQWLKLWREQLRRNKTGHVRSRRKNTKRARLRLEPLEDRTVPSIIFGNYPSVTVSDGNGPVLADTHVELVFWGSKWNDSPSPTPSSSTVQTAVDSILGGPYLSKLSQYRSSLGSASLIGTVFITDSSPGSNFVNSDVSTMLTNKIADGTITVTPETDSKVLYMVITQSGSSDPSEGLGGEHASSSYQNSSKQNILYHYGWTVNNGTLDTVTYFFSHELAEAVSDPEGTAIQNNPRNASSWNEVSDGTAQSYSYRLNNYLVQSYWSQNDTAYVVPTGQSQDLFVASDGTLTIKGDQLGSNYADKLTLNSNGFGVAGVLNGESFSFDPGKITAIIVKLGGGQNTVNVQNLARNMNMQVIGGGSDAVNIGFAGSTQGIVGNLVITNPPSLTTISVDDSADTQAHTVTLDKFTGPPDGDGDSDVFGRLTGLFQGTVSYEYFDTSSLTVKTGDGGVQVNVLATGVPTNLIGTTLGSSSTDTTVNVGNAGSLAGIAGTLNIENPRWYSAITVDDSADNSAPTVMLSTLGSNPADSESNSDPWGQISGLPGGANINYEYFDTRSLTLKTGGGTTVDVLATGVTTNLVGAGSTTVKLAPDAQMLASLQGPLILDGGGTGDFTLDDSTDSTATTYIIDAATVRVGTLPSISYADLHNLTVNGGTSVDVYNVESTAAGTPVTITAAGFSNTFNVTPTHEELGLLQADLTINPGRVSSVILNDENGATFAANPGPATYSLSSTVFFPPNSNVLSHGLNVQSSTASGSVFINGPGATLYGSSLDDTYNVESIPGGVGLNLGTGHNTVNICPTTHTMMRLEGDVTINGGGTTDVVINDQAYDSFAPAVAATYTLSSHLRLFGSQLRQALIVQNTNTSASVIVAGTGSVTLNGLRGNLLGNDDSLKDIYNVESTVADMPVTLNTGTSNDTVNVGSDPVNLAQSTLDDIHGAVTVNGVGGSTTLNVNDLGTTSQEWYDISASQVLRYPWTFGQPLGDPTQTINYFNVKYLNVYGGSGQSGGVQDIVAAHSTLASTALTSLYGGTGPNEFIVENAFDTLDDIQGPVALHGGSSGDFAAIIDQLNTVGHNYTLTAGRVQRDKMADITYDGLGEVIVATADNPYFGHSPSTVNVQSTFNGLTGVEVGNKDIVTVGSGAGVQPPIPSTTAGIVGQLGIVVPYAGDKPSVTIDDSGDTNPRQVDFSSDSYSDYLVNGLAGTSQNPGQIYFRLEPATSVSILTGAGDDTFHVHDLTNAPALTLNGGGGNNTLQGPNAGNTWQISGANSGTLNGTVKFVSVQNLTGGSAADTFKFQTGGSLSGKLDGGAGTNTLDYSAFVGTVTVDLPLSIATAVAKGVLNIQNVNGSQGNDLIVGDANPNTLRGGTGRSVIIGGGGGDQIYGGGGDNILIGGTTDYTGTAGLAALQAIFKEFLQTYNAQDPVADFATRVNNIKKSKGTLAGPLYHLDAGNVHASILMDQITGGGGLNWFFAAKPTEINGGTGPGKNDVFTQVK